MVHGKVPEDMMAVNEISSKQKGEGPLYLALKREIELMRELLANLHEEELALLERNQRRWFEIMQIRSDQIVLLRDLRIERFSLALRERISEDCSLISLIDQMIALNERINLQNCRNEALFHQAKNRPDLPLHCSYPHPLHAEKVQPIRKKTALEN